MNRININGKSISVQGSNISVVNGNVYVDGKLVEENLSGDVKISFEGSLASLTVDGSAKVYGDVKGDVRAGNSVKCGDVEGSVDAGNSIKCGNIGGSAEAGNSIVRRG